MIFEPNEYIIDFDKGLNNIWFEGNPNISNNDNCSFSSVTELDIYFKFNLK